MHNHIFKMNNNYLIHLVYCKSIHIMRENTYILIGKDTFFKLKESTKTYFFLLSLTLLYSPPSHSPAQKPRKNPPLSFFFNYSPYHSYLQSTYPLSLFPLALSPFSSIHCKQVPCQESASKPWRLIVL